MSPHPAITPAPILPRQQDPNDPYGISSMLASLSALYPDLYSDNSFSSYSLDAYYSSLMSEYSSLTALYSLTGFPTVPTTTATRPGLTTTTGIPTRTGGTSVTGTAAGASGTSIPDNNNNDNNNNNGGLSTGAKIGIGVGVALGLLLLAGIGILIWCMGKKKGKTSTTIVGPGSQPGFAPQQPPSQPTQQFQPQPQMGYVNSQGYMQGVPQQSYPQQSISPPPQYAQQQQAVAGQPGMAGGYAPYAKGPDPNIAELEHEYHFAKPGVVEIADGTPEQAANGRGRS